MHGVNPGAELGRYTLDAHLETVSGGQRWTARDTTLERGVTLLVMPADDDHTAAALDAARRAAGIESSQLVRILDVGTEGSLAWVCEEGLDDPTDLTSHIGARGLPADEVRRISGEVATGLEAARVRGLHHLALTPESVLLTPDGRVKVRGLATAAALAGIETEGEEADREDATAVVALAYAGLTATWPLDTPSGVPAAPRGEDGPPAPSRVAVGVPGDLDTICRETLGDGSGPDSPGDYAAQIAPWSRTPLTGSVPTRPAADTSTDTAAEPGRGTGSGTGAAGAAAGAAVAGGASAAGGAAASTTGGAGGSGSGTGTGPDDDDDADTNEIPQYREDADGPGTATATAAGAGAGAGAGADGGTAAGSGGTDDSDAAEDGSGRAAAAAAVAAGAVGTGAKVISDRLGKASKTAADRSREALHEARARREAIREDRTQHSSLGAAPVSAEIEPPAPLLPAEAGQAPTREQSNLVLLIVAACVVVACVLGAIGTAQIGDGSDLDEILSGDGSTPTASPTTSGETSEPDSSESASGDGSDGPFAILNAAGYDPLGDGVEHNAEAQRIYDGDPDTTWTTEGYATPDFGGGKDGVGVAVDLGQSHDISSVTLELPDSANAVVYAGDSASTSGTEIGSSEGATGEVTLETEDPVTARYVTVWFTSLTPDGEGRYRASLGEITVR